MRIFRAKAKKNNDEQSNDKTKSYCSMASSSDEDDSKSIATTSSHWSRVFARKAIINKSSKLRCISINNKDDDRNNNSLATMVEKTPVPIPSKIETNKQLEIDEELLLPKAIDATRSRSSDGSSITSFSTFSEGTATIGSLAAANAFSVVNYCYSDNDTDSDDNDGSNKLYRPTSSPTESEVVRPVLYKRDIHVAGNTKNTTTNIQYQSSNNNSSTHSSESIAATSANVTYSYFNNLDSTENTHTKSNLYKRDKHVSYDDALKETKLTNVPSQLHNNSDNYMSSNLSALTKSPSTTPTSSSASTGSTLPSYSVSGSMMFRDMDKKSKKKKKKSKNPYNATTSATPPKPKALPSNSIMGSMLFRTMEHGGDSNNILSSTTDSHVLAKRQELCSRGKGRRAGNVVKNEGYFSPDSDEGKENSDACSSIVSRPNSIFSMIEATGQLGFDEEGTKKTSLCEA